MAASVRYDDVQVGSELPAQSFEIHRLDLVKYAGASGDFNVIHWNERIAMSVGLPDVIAHGMLTMAEAARVVTDWLGDPGAVLDYSVRFTRPVVVPDDDAGALLEVSGSVVDMRADKQAVVELLARADGAKVLAKARVLVQLG